MLYHCRFHLVGLFISSGPSIPDARVSLVASVYTPPRALPRDQEHERF